MKTKHLIVSLVSISLLAGSIIYTDNAISNQPAPQASTNPEPPQQVSVIELSAQSYPAKFSLYAEVKAKTSLIVKSQINAPVTWLHPHFTNGARLKKGEPIIELEQTSTLADIASAKRAQADALLALKLEQRQAKQAKAEWKRSGVKQKPSALLMRKPQLAAANARYQDAKMALNRAQYFLEQTRIQAPFDAVIKQTNLTLASFAQTGESLATLEDSSTSQITVDLTPKQWKLLPTDLTKAKVIIKDPQLPQGEWRGVITQLSSQVQPNTRQRQALIEVSHPLAGETPLFNGSFVEITVEGKVIDNLFALPSAALSAKGELWYLQDNQLQNKAKEVLFSTADSLFVKQGDLPSQVQVVKRPLASFLPTMPVSATHSED